MGKVFLGEIYLPLVASSGHPGDGKKASRNKNKIIEQKPSAGINSSCSFVQGIFFLTSCPRSFKVTTDRHEDFSWPNKS
jgi:hypothetical protein